MKIGFLSGAYPPAVDGIGDHTRLLAGEFVSRGHEVVVFTGFQPAFAADDGIVVRGIFSPSRPATVRALVRAVQEARPDRLIVQYNPFGFGPRGFNPWLAPTLRRIRKECHVSVIFHETHVPAESLRERLMQTWQIPQFAFMCRMADTLFSSCERWQSAIRRIAGREAILLPVGSNVPLSPLTREEARARLAIRDQTRVLGVFGSAHPSRLLDWMAAAADRLASRHEDILLLSIGADGEKIRPLLARNIRFLDCGLLAAEEVGARLRAVDLFLSPFVDGLSTRRGSAAAAFQHGLPVLSTSSRWTDAILRCQEQRLIFLSPVADGTGAFAALAARTAPLLPFPGSAHASLADFYRSHFDWPVIAQKLLDVPAEPSAISL